MSNEAFPVSFELWNNGKCISRHSVRDNAEKEEVVSATRRIYPEITPFAPETNELDDDRLQHVNALQRYARVERDRCKTKQYKEKWTNVLAWCLLILDP